jgi:hypothetical protein
MPLPGYFPNVPDLPGVPQIPRSPLAAVQAVLSIGLPADPGTLPNSSQAASFWGVFDSNNNQVITPDSIIDFNNRNEWNVVSSTVEQGSFASYNKVVVPFELSVRMSKGGSVANRTTFLQQIAAIAGDTNLYTVQTPEWTYTDVNITRYEVSRRGASGAYFLAEVDIFFVQILEVTPVYTNTSLSTQDAQDPSAEPVTNQGNVNPEVTTQLGAAAVQQFEANIGK